MAVEQGVSTCVDRDGGTVNTGVDECCCGGCGTGGAEWGEEQEEQL